MFSLLQTCFWWLDLVFLVPLEGAKAATVTLVDGQTAMHCEADLHTSERMRTATGLSYTLDWSAVDEDSSGQPFDPQLGDRLIVGHVAVDTVGEVEGMFLQLLGEADAIYRLDIRGLTDSALADATDADGVSFPGFSTDGVWLVGVECTTCTSPAPLLLGVVDVLE